jgi:hypothetical protein
MEKTRKCCKCLANKPISSFYKRKTDNTYFYTCIDCSKELRRIKSKSNNNDLPNEIWKDAFSYEGLYKVSNFGRIKSVEKIITRSDFKTYFVKEYIFSKSLNTEGYASCCLVNHNGVKKTKNIHVIVAKTFIPNPENKPQVNHINGIKSDNRVENLEWCTRKENAQHAFKNGLLKISKGESHGRHKLKEEKIIAIRRLYKIKPSVKISGIAKKLNISVSQVNRILKRKCWTHI